MKVNEKTWDGFTVEELFSEIKATKGETTGQLILGDDVPYIAAAKTNNGFSHMCSTKEHSDWVSNGNTIVFVQLGDGAAGLAHYIPMDFIGMSGKTSSGYNSYLSENNGIFIARCLSSNKAIFSHGHSWTGRRLLTTKTMLPTNDAGKPDYDYMSNYTLNKRKILYQKYRNFISESIELLSNEYKQIPSISELDWKPFYVPNIFSEIERGKRIKKANQFSGKVPYVSSTAQNNGVDGFIEASTKTRVFNDCISLANSGSVGSAFYEPFQFVASDHITHLKQATFNKWIYLFLTVTIQKQRNNFNFNREINDTRIKKMKIMLPINEDNEPDFRYMEQYSKNMMLKKYKQYLSFLDAKEDCV